MKSIKKFKLSSVKSISEIQNKRSKKDFTTDLNNEIPLFNDSNRYNDTNDLHRHPPPKSIIDPLNPSGNPISLPSPLGEPAYLNTGTGEITLKKDSGIEPYMGMDVFLEHNSYSNDYTVRGTSGDIIGRATEIHY